MAFYCYILRCSDDSYYTGQTEDLTIRLAQHERGTFADCYTYTRRPVTLAWSQDFGSRHEALEAERRIKGWSRPKKEALIVGDWDGVSVLARNWQVGAGPSTGSGQTESGMMQQTVELSCHPNTPAASIKSVAVEICITDAEDVLLTFSIAPADALAIPEPVSPARADGLWQRTCCELFLKPEGGERYFEFNLSPSGQWAAYAFDNYRAGMRNLVLPVDPHIEVELQGEAFVLEADVDLAAIPAGRLRASLTAVIEETDGTKSYWALNHPPGAPDFHHPDCFALELPAPEGA